MNPWVIQPMDALARSSKARTSVALGFLLIDVHQNMPLELLSFKLKLRVLAAA